ncbi:MAG: hypothetical protein H7067_15360 [Burkholderiales bacterium]|nr:hypothetical protein [Opitutaceae bacterium]
MNPTDLHFKISTSAELTALRETERELIKAVTVAKALGKGDDLKKFGSELAGVQQRLGQFSPGQKITAEVLDVASKVPVLGSAMSALNGSLGPVSIALGVGAAALATASKAVSEYADQESAVVKLNTALANSGQYSEAASEQVQELANKYKDLTGIDDSKFLSAARTLIQFGADRSQLDAYLETVTNLAGLMGGDVEAAANLFGKALQGNTDVLGRYGIKVDSAATQTQKLDSIMQQAAARGAGQLTAGSETLNRKFGDLRLGTDDVLKGLGNLISRTGIVQFGLDSMSGVLMAINMVLPSTAKVSGDFANKLGQMGDNAVEAARKLEEAKKAGEGLADVKLTKLTDEAAAADRAFARLTAQIRATEQAQVALTDAKLARDLAQIDDDEKTGKLSATGAADARFTTKQAAEREKTRLQLASIDAQKAEEQKRVGNANADVGRRQSQIDGLTGAGAKASDTATVRERQIGDNARAFQPERQAREDQLAELRSQLNRVIAENRYNGKEITDAKTDPILKQISDLENTNKAADDSFGAEQKRLREQLDAATVEAARIKAEIEKLKPELEKAKEAADQVRKDAEGKTGALDIQATSIRATQPIKEEAAAIQNREAERAAEEKDRQARLAAERELESADASNIGARTGVKLGGLKAPDAQSAELIAKAREAAQKLGGDQDVSSADTAAFATALSELVVAVEKAAPKSQTGADLKAILAMVRSATSRIGTLEAQQGSNRTLD